MLNCLSLVAGEVILIVACVAIVAGVIAAKIVRVVKRDGHSCGGDCSCCGCCSSCKPEQKRRDGKTRHTTTK